MAKGELDKECSRWVEIKPEGISGAGVGGHKSPMMVPIFPGTDNSWKNLQDDLPHCFTPEQKMEYLRQLDILIMQESLEFKSKLDYALENCEVDDYCYLQRILREFSQLACSEDLRTLGVKALGSRAKMLELFELIRLYVKELNTGVKGLDSLALSTYTQGIDKGKVEDWIGLVARKVSQALMTIGSVLEFKVATKVGSKAVGVSNAALKVAKYLDDGAKVTEGCACVRHIYVNSICGALSKGGPQLGYGISSYGLGGYGL